jgi:hypothetical protein
MLPQVPAAIVVVRYKKITFWVGIQLAMKRQPTIMKLCLVACSLLFFMGKLVAQQESTDEEALADTYGNRYLLKDWSPGIVRFTSGREVKDFKLKFDCLKHQLLLQFKGATFAAESRVREFVLLTGGGKTKDSLLFRKGFPAVDKTTASTYFQVLFEQKVTLLRLFTKTIIEEKQVVGKPRRRLEDEEKFYLLKAGNMIALPADKEGILQALPDQAEALSKFITDHHLRFKSADDYLLLIRHYNDLLP